MRKPGQIVHLKYHEDHPRSRYRLLGMSDGHYLAERIDWDGIPIAKPFWCQLSETGQILSWKGFELEK